MSIMYVLDSNIISYLLKGDLQVREKLREAIKSDVKLVMPHIVHYEIERWLIERGAINKRNEFERMINDEFSLVELNLDVWKIAADLYVKTRKLGRQIGDGDLLIASFCLIHNITLVTNNIDDFSIIDELKFINWKIN